jgi:hypothetical protein
MESDFRRLASIWTSLPSCSLVVFRHLQKTGGSSVVKLFEDLERDLQWTVDGSWTPCWRGRAQYVAMGRLRWVRGLRAYAEVSRHNRSEWQLDTPPWQPRHFVHVHHPDAGSCGGLAALQREIGRLRPSAVSLGCNVVVAMLVRRPWEFYVSWWYYVGARRCDDCAFVEYVRLNPNAQSHMAVGGMPRQYSQALLARHTARDSALTRSLQGVLRGVDLLAPTESLDEFVWLLCERAGIGICPRPGMVNVRSRQVTHDVRRSVIARAGGNGESSGMTSTLAPNATLALHSKAVHSSAWLDLWFHKEAERSLRSAMAVGGVDVAALRRRRLEEWRRLPADRASGCLEFSPASPPEVLAALKASPLTSSSSATFRHGAGGLPESMVLRIVAPTAGTTAATGEGNHFEQPGDGKKGGNSRDGPARCAAVRSAARLATQEVLPAALRPALLHSQRQTSSSVPRWLSVDASPHSLPTPGMPSGEIAAVCSTKVRMPNVPRGCHLD